MFQKFIKKQQADIPQFQEIEVDLLDPNPFQTREEDLEGIDQLAESIGQCGLQQPPKVWKKDGRWVICYGHQRIAAVRKLGWKTVLCRIEERTDYNTEGLALDCVTENLHRTDLSAFERARSFAKLEDAFGYDRPTMATKLRIHAKVVGRYLAILEAPPYLLEAFRTERLNFSICKLLQRLDRSSGEGTTKEFLGRLQREEISRSELTALAEPYLRKDDKEARQKSDSDGEALSESSWFFREGTKYGLRELALNRDEPIDTETWNEIGRELALFLSAAGAKTCEWKVGNTGVSVNY